jgi:hypothetical protein
MEMVTLTLILLPTCSIPLSQLASPSRMEMIGQVPIRCVMTSLGVQRAPGPGWVTQYEPEARESLLRWPLEPQSAG